MDAQLKDHVSLQITESEINSKNYVKQLILNWTKISGGQLKVWNKIENSNSLKI
jgi:hypothetical protein